MQQLLDAIRQLGSPDVARIGIGPLLTVLLVSLASSLFVAYLYQVFYRARATGSQVYRAFPLMGISITAIFVAVQFSLPLSLGLLGALSIVRFRTPIKEPEEIGFILLVIATSLSAATFNLMFLGLILAVAVAALLLLRARVPLVSSRLADGMMLVTLPAGRSAAIDGVLDALRTELPKGSVDSVTDGEHEISISYRFRGLDQQQVAEIYGRVKALEGEPRPSIFFHEAGDV
ncbi:MAG: DUF4956 domain-containing protein [Acidobacteriota bacterium]|jgi:hypothetical protein